MKRPSAGLAGALILAVTGTFTSFHAQVPFQLPGIVRGLQRFDAVTDVNGDGRQELVGVVGGVLTVWSLGPSSGLDVVFTLPLTFTATGVAIGGDFNGDGFGDVALASTTGPTLGIGVVLFLASGGTTLSIGGFTPTAQAPLKLMKGEVNGDGLDDVLSMGGVLGLPLSEIQWLVSAGNVLAPAPAFPFLPLHGVRTQDIAVLDADSDQRSDVALNVTGFAAAQGILILLCPNGNIQPGPFLPATANFTMSMIAIDSDGDLDQDLLIEGWANLASDLQITHVVQGNAGTWSLGPTSVFPGPVTGRTGSMAASDFDGDGDVDLLIRQTHIPLLPFQPGSYVFYRQEAPRSFAPRLVVRHGNFPGDAPIACDLDGDGFDDVVAGNEWWLRNRDISERPADAPFDQVTMIAFDVDHDGDLDYFDRIQLRYRLSQGGAPGASSPWIPVTLPPINPVDNYVIDAVGDLDLDQRLDIIVHVETDTGPTPYQTLRLEHSGAITNLGNAFVPGTGPIDFSSFAVADFDLDLDFDLALPSGIALRLPNGLFSMVPGLPPNADIATAGDVDFDGDQDILVTIRSPWVPGSFVTDRIGWLLNDGSLGFFPSAMLSAQIFPGLVASSITTGDLDLDGDLEIAFLRANLPSPPALVILAWQGPGPAQVLTFQAFDTAGLVAIQDLNLDGAPDLLMTGPRNALSTTAEVLYGTVGAVSISRRQEFLISNAKGLIDIDGDGDQDIIGEFVEHNVSQSPPGNGARRQFGSGTPGSGGFAPVLGVGGILRTGQAVTLRLRSCVGGTPALLAFASQESNLPNFPVPGVTTLVFPWQALMPTGLTSGPFGIAGAGTQDIPLTIPPALALQSLFLQAATSDPAAPSTLTLSNGLELRIGI